MVIFSVTYLMNHPITGKMSTEKISLVKCQMGNCQLRSGQLGNCHDGIDTTSLGILRVVPYEIMLLPVLQ